MDKIGGVASGRAFKPEVIKLEVIKQHRTEDEMKNTRELVGSLTQARVQMLAAQAIIEDAANNCVDRVECELLELDARKLERCVGIAKDVRERYAGSNEPPKES